MIVQKEWKAKYFGGTTKYWYKGWFLFGIIPLFIIRESAR